MDMAKGPVLTPLASPGRISHDLMAAPSAPSPRPSPSAVRGRRYTRTWPIPAAGC